MAIDTAKLGKVLALMDSPNAGEGAAAMARATSMLATAGKTWLDLPAIFGAAQAAPQEASATARAAATDSPFRGFDDFMEEEEPGYKAAQAAKQRQQARNRAAFRAAVIAHYGSEEAALAPTPMEIAVDAAAAPFLREEMYDYANGRFPQRTLQGWEGWGNPVPAPVAAAVRGALPLPTTVAEAKAEYEAWMERDRELAAIHGGRGDSFLSLGCSLREMLIYDMVTHELRANTIEDAIVRWRFIMDSENVPKAEEMEAVLGDLEYLAEKDGTAVQSGQPETVTARRMRILNLLSNVDTAALSDREIARRVGVSPQTVGNIRRKLRH